VSCWVLATGRCGGGIVDPTGCSGALRLNMSRSPMCRYLQFPPSNVVYAKDKRSEDPLWFERH
jgi:hypothetical protein